MITIAHLAAAALLITDNELGALAIISIFVAFPIALAWARLLWKRGSVERPAAPSLSGEMGARLTQMQQSIDAMAIEVERISEGQRFVTKLLADRSRERIAP